MIRWFLVDGIVAGLVLLAGILGFFTGNQYGRFMERNAPPK